MPITVALSENSRRDLATLENLPVPTSNGGSVPLKAVADIGFGAGPTTVQRTNQIRRIAVGADLAPGLVTGDVWPQINQLPTMKNLPRGVSKLNLGDQKWQAELMYYFAIALVSGVLLVFAVLVLLYRRFLAPFVNMGSLLIAPLGSAIALHLTGNPLSLPVLIGILMLFGIVAKNSILLVDFAVEMMNHGMPKDEAIYEAGHKRAQPIVMTTVAMVAGMLPIALVACGRRQLARADGHHRDRRPDLLDGSDAGARAGLLLDRDRHRAVDRAQVPPHGRPGRARHAVAGHSPQPAE